MYVFSVFYCLCYAKETSLDMLEEQLSEEIDLYLNEDKYIIIENIRRSIVGIVLRVARIRRIFMP